jgi:hypothetical protein
MLTIVDDRDRIERHRLAVMDPFQQAAPAWQHLHHVFTPAGNGGDHHRGA